MIKGVLCEAVGLLIAYAGWRLMKSHESPTGDTTFSGPILSSTTFWNTLKGLGSYLVLALGLMLMMIFGPFFFIAAR